MIEDFIRKTYGTRTQGATLREARKIRSKAKPRTPYGYGIGGGKDQANFRRIRSSLTPSMLKSQRPSFISDLNESRIPFYVPARTGGQPRGSDMDKKVKKELEAMSNIIPAPKLKTPKKPIITTQPRPNKIQPRQRMPRGMMFDKDRIPTNPYYGNRLLLDA
jgi:hypothetical protein